MKGRKKSRQRLRRQKLKNLRKPAHKQIRGDNVKPTNVENPKKGGYYDRNIWRNDAIKTTAEGNSKVFFIFQVMLKCVKV